MVLFLILICIFYDFWYSQCEHLKMAHSLQNEWKSMIERVYSIIVREMGFLAINQKNSDSRGR